MRCYRRNDLLLAIASELFKFHLQNSLSANITTRENTYLIIQLYTNYLLTVIVLSF